MNEPVATSPMDCTPAIEKLRLAFGDRMRADPLIRALYATDASIYEIMPDAVVWPKSTDELVAIVKICRDTGAPLTARGAGTGLAGGAVNRGVQMDCSRYLNRILRINPDQRKAWVEPGVVLDELNAACMKYGLHFAPDVAPSSRATLGGMIANNSCGARSVHYGRTVDHVLSLDVVLSDGSRCMWGAGRDAGGGPLARSCEQVLTDVCHEYADEIARRYPNVMRRNGGYGLDRLRSVGPACRAGPETQASPPSRSRLPGGTFSHGPSATHVGWAAADALAEGPARQAGPTQGRINPETIVCGSEGTLCIVVGAELNLAPLPVCKGLLVVQFTDLWAALDATPVILTHRPTAVELVDKLILDATRGNPAMARRRWFLQGDPCAVLIVEMFDDAPGRLEERLRAVAADLAGRSLGYAYPLILDPNKQTDVWDVRKAGLGLLMSRPGDRHPYDFVDDTAVDPSRLRAYIEQFAAVLKDEGVEESAYYAHASVGCLHVRPVLNLRDKRDVARMRRIAERVADLALAFGGAMTGEHGDGLVRSCWLEKMYGPRIVEAFAKIKKTFDPAGILNPGKIVNPLAMTENLRYTAVVRGEPVQTRFDFSTHGGMAGLASMCSGVGQCRQKLTGDMCPSYMATGDEMHTTRARANALRLALSDRGLLNGLDDPALEEVMDLCLSCKACKTECPTGVDMAKLKSEWLYQRQRLGGVPRRSRLIARSTEWAEWGCRLAPLSNWLMQSRPMRAFLERFYGLDRRMSPPIFARETFRQWFRRTKGLRVQGAKGLRVQTAECPPPQPLRPSNPPTLPGQIVYFVDTWTDYFTPQVGIAAVQLLERLGYQVIVPPRVCCGRPHVSKGLLDEAARLAERNIEILRPYAEQGVPIICTEPSCASIFLDEAPQLVRTSAAKAVSKAVVMIETWLAREIEQRQLPSPNGSSLAPGCKILYHGHCHQKALIGTGDAMRVLNWATGGRAEEIDSGCCGMAGSFGHEKGHYQTAMAVGEERLFPAIRARGSAQVVVSGFSCRQQIEHHAGASTLHAMQVLHPAIVAGSPEPLDRVKAQTPLAIIS